MVVMYIVIGFVIFTQYSKPGMGKEWPAEEIFLCNYNVMFHVEM